MTPKPAWCVWRPLSVGAELWHPFRVLTIFHPCPGVFAPGGRSTPGYLLARLRRARPRSQPSWTYVLMPDVFTKAKRSEVMSRIRSRGNKETELALVRLLRLHRITGWRRHQPVFGKPDFVFPKRRLAVFVDGCFWHGCPKHATQPANNRAFWRRKFTANKARDRLVTRALRRQGWSVLRIWEHELARKNLPRLLRKILRVLTPHPGPLPIGCGEGVNQRRIRRALS